MFALKLELLLHVLDLNGRGYLVEMSNRSGDIFCQHLRTYIFKKEPLQGDLPHVFSIFGEVGV